jgi:holin-like protein LrgB
MTPYFGIIVSIVAYGIGMILFKKTKGFFLFTPLFVSMVLGILFLKLAHFSYADYNNGGKIINFFLDPATVAFAIPLYKQADKLKKYWKQIMASIVVGSVFSVVIVFIISKGLGLNAAVMKSMLPEAATTAIALPLSKGIGGIDTITSFAVILNAVIVYAVGTTFLKIFKVKNPISRGLALGTSGHALGAARSMELGEVEGAMASIAVVVVGVITVVVVPIFVRMLAI